jgi:hypothetical protein
VDDRQRHLREWWHEVQLLKVYVSGAKRAQSTLRAGWSRVDAALYLQRGWAGRVSPSCSVSACITWYKTKMNPCVAYDRAIVSCAGNVVQFAKFGCKTGCCLTARFRHDGRGLARACPTIFPGTRLPPFHPSPENHLPHHLRCCCKSLLYRCATLQQRTVMI